MNNIPLADMFGDRNWRPFSKSLNKEKGLYPNRAYYNRATREAVIVVNKTNSGNFRLSKLSLDYVLNAQGRDDKVLRAFIVLRHDAFSITASLPAIDVQEKLKNVRTFTGRFGPYWRLDASFNVARAKLNEAPF